MKMRGCLITTLLVIAVVSTFIEGVVAFALSFLMPVGTLRLIYAGLGALAFVCSIVEFFCFLYLRRMQPLPKEVHPEEVVERWRRDNTR
jgi:hypothetical protein